MAFVTTEPINPRNALIKRLIETDFQILEQRETANELARILIGDDSIADMDMNQVIQFLDSITKTSIDDFDDEEESDEETKVDPREYIGGLVSATCHKEI
ncbi:hypothetical protein BJX63DRAFT_438832 [Aspergillus granulosus]|uniref:Uncharacterized protein n=1 Tax=Aspergillus granulosus TaxID=176169 RepID=A0ABR4GSG4_9EURO